MAENLFTLTNIVRKAGEQNEEKHRRFEEFHREVDEGFHVFTKMMDEWIRGQQKQNGRP